MAHRPHTHSDGIGQRVRVRGRGLHSLIAELNLRTFGNTLLTLELNLITLVTHQRVELDYMQLNLSGKGQSKLKLSGNGNECKPLVRGGPDRQGGGHAAGGPGGPGGRAVGAAVARGPAAAAKVGRCMLNRWNPC